MVRSAVAAVIAAILIEAPAVAHEYTRFQSLVVTPALRPGEPAGCTSLALLNLPPAWHTGDAAVVMFAPWKTPDPARDRLVSAMLFEDAAVLELGTAPCLAAETTDPVDPLAEAMGALVSLRREAGAGVVVVIGYGQGAHRMLDTVSEAEASARLGADGPRFAAAAAFGDGAPAFALGAAHPPRDRVPTRLGMLCDALGTGAGSLAEALRGAPTTTAVTCRAAFAGPVNARDTTPRD